MTDQRHGNTTEVVLAWILTTLTLLYFLPWAIAATRGKSNSVAIFVVNLLVGWTFIGWIVALVMACGSHQVVAMPQISVAHVQNYAQPQAMPSQLGAGTATPLALTATAAQPAAGWYPQPDGAHRWWDGAQWTEHRSGQPAQ